MSTSAAITLKSSAAFGDLGQVDEEEKLVKMELAKLLRRAMKRKQMNQTEAGKMFGLDQLDVSRLVRGDVGGYSTDRLLGYLMELGCDIHISIVPAEGDEKGQVVFR